MRRTTRLFGGFAALALGLSLAGGACGITTPVGVWPRCTIFQWSYSCEGLVSDNSCGCKVTNKRMVAPFCATSEPDAVGQFSARFANTIPNSVNCIQGAKGTVDPSKANANSYTPRGGYDISEAPSLAMAGLAPRAVGDAGVSVFGPGDCTVDPATDNACTGCAKTSCCSQYLACFGDSSNNCTCWIGCKAQGFDDAQCAQPSVCGPLDSVSSAAAACLNGNCGTECGLMSTGTGGSGAGGAGSCDCGGTSSSSSSSSGSTCVPGGGQAGDACVDDSGCASCNCSSGTCY